MKYTDIVHETAVIEGYMRHIDIVHENSCRMLHDALGIVHEITAIGCCMRHIDIVHETTVRDLTWGTLTSFMKLQL